MANFGKLNFSTSFKPTSAFPLDARTYFEGDDAYDRAAAAAASAAEPGSTTTLYHYGMKLLVNQGGVYTWYEITTERALRKEAEGGGESDPTTEWRLNSIIDLTAMPDIPISISFTSNGTLYSGMRKIVIDSANNVIALYYCVDGTPTTSVYIQNDNHASPYPVTSWSSDSYAWITIHEEITDANFYAWLKANATLLNEDESSGNMPIIRFCGARGNKGGDQGTEPSLTLYKGIYLTVEIVGGGALKTGDALQLCNMKTYHYGKNADNNKYKKQKLRRFTEYVITEDDLNKKYLTIPVNLLGDDADKIAQAMMHNGRMDDHRVSPIYIRIRRPKGDLQTNESGMTVDADFSNIVRITRKYTREKMHFE